MRLALLILAAPSLVLVPEGGPEDRCVARERVSAATQLSPGLRLRRAPLLPDETLAAARQRLGADVAIDASWSEASGAEVRAVTEQAVVVSQAQGPPGQALAEAAGASWPKGHPTLEPWGLSAVGNEEAMAAACRSDAQAAFRLAGAAVPPRMAGLVPPSDPMRQGTLLQRWAWARAEARTDPKCRRALPVLRAVARDFEQGNLPPAWRHGFDKPRPSVGISRWSDTWLSFEEDRFLAVDAASGQPRWRRRAVGAEPEPVPVGAHHVAIVTEDRITVVDVRTGTAAWSAELEHLVPDVAAEANLVVAATHEQILAMNALTGEVRWSHDGLSRPSSGPRIVRGLVVAPLQSRLDILDPRKGERVRSIELGDEISAPIMEVSDGSVWVAVGAEELVRVDPSSGEITQRTSDLYGLIWPPVVVAQRAAGLVRGRRGRLELAFVDPSRPKSRRIQMAGLEAPVLGLSDYSGVVHASSRPPAIIARDLTGKQLWRARQRQSVQALHAPGDLVVAAVGRRVVVVDRQRGKQLWQVELEGPVADVRYDARGGVAVLEDGTLYGLPAGRDPRPKAYLQRARLDLAACELAQGQYTAAERTAGRVLSRSVDQLDALAILARARQARRRPEAVAAWLDLTAAAPAHDPLVEEARAALDDLAGIQGWARPAAPVTNLVAARGDVIIGQDAAGLIALDALSGRVAWRAPGPGEPTSAGLVAGGRILSYADGRPRAKPEDGATAVDEAVLRRSGPQQLERWAEEGAPDWQLELDHAGLLPWAASDRFVVLASTTAEGRAMVVAADSGRRIWMRPLETTVLGATVFEESILMQTADGLWGLDATTGARQFRLATPKDLVRVTAGPKGWLLQQARRLTAIDTRGRRGYAVGLAADAQVRVGASGKTAFIFTKDTLLLVDMERRRNLGRLTGLEVLDLVVGPDRAVALLADGRVLRIDPTRGLSLRAKQK